jgi:KDO2-lipid IV(A) lauroyltransferase
MQEGQVARPREHSDGAWSERLENRAFGAMLWVLGRFGFQRRVRIAGWIMAHLVAPLAGMRRRVRANLAHACPDLPDAEVERLVRAVPDNLGRMIAEMFSPEDFRALCDETPFSGPGLEALAKAKAEGRGAVIVSGHFGNYDVFRAGLIHRDFEVGGLYRPMNNALFNARYVDAITRLGEPLFPRGRRGFGDMVRHLKDGKVVALLTDQHMRHGASLSFFGKPALTALSAAQLALKHDVPLIPIYAIRQPDGHSFHVELEAPIPPGDKDVMMQQINDSLEARVRANMHQWLWTHKRWKGQPQVVHDA